MNNKLASKNEKLLVAGILFLFFTVIFIQHTDMTLVSDDYWNTYDGGLLNEPLKELVRIYYYENTGKICSDVLAHLIYRIPFMLWKALDSLVYVAMALLIAFIFAEISPMYITVTCLLMLFYPKWYLQSAGFIMTSTNYIYTILGLLLGLLPIKLLYNGGKNKPLLFLSSLLGVLGIFYATNQDQTAMGIIGAFFLYSVWLIFSEKNNIRSCVSKGEDNRIIKKVTFIGLIVSIIFYAFMFCIPAHLARAFEPSSGGRFSIPDYNSWSLFRKIYHGYTTTAANIIFNRCNVYIIAVSFLFILAIFSDSKAKKIVGSIPFGISLLIKSVGSSTFTYYYDYCHDVADLKAFSEKDGIIAIFLSFAAILLITTAIIMLFSDKKNAWFALSALIIGGGSHLMMGFSATLYGSSFRTLTLTLYSLMVLSLLIFKEIKLRESKVSMYMVLMTLLLTFTL